VALGVKTSALVVLVLVELSAAVTPAGTPEIVRFTLLLRPTGFTTLIVLVAFVPPTRSVKLLAEAERLKLGVGMLRTMVAVLVTAPEVPVTVTV
jgi:hypothetical protein